MLIGEGPGRNEDENGVPFCGAAGRFLDELLQIAGLERKGVYITNVVKCRPPGNRDPMPDEIGTCTSNYLNRQIEAINPKMIVTLGRHSMGLFMPDAKISRVHGKPVEVGGRMIVPMFHPAAALHQPALHDDVVADFSHLPEWIAKMNQAAKKQAPRPPASDPEPKNPDPSDDEPKQLSLF